MFDWFTARIPILSIICYLPLVGVLIALFMNKDSDTIRGFATGVALVDFLVCRCRSGSRSIVTASSSSSARALLDPVDRRALRVRHRRHIALLDGAADHLLGVLAFLSSWSAIEEREKEYYIFMLLLQTGMLGVFMAMDFFLFYVFWEVMLVPMYFLIGIWGGPRRLYAAIKFFLYTLVGSVLMLLGILALYFYNSSGSSRLGRGWATKRPSSFRSSTRSHRRDPGATCSSGSSWRFFVGFAIKVPMFPFHTWLPDAHVEAPTAGSVILAGSPAEDGHLRLCAFLAADSAGGHLASLLPWMAGCRSSASSTARWWPWRRRT